MPLHLNHLRFKVFPLIQFCFALLIFFTFEAHSQKKILVTGLSKTKLDVIERELELVQSEMPENESLGPELERRLRRMQIFSSVQVLQENPEEIQIAVEEKWTTIPILKVASGGGVTQTTLGVYDPNIFGAWIESGAQYEQLGTEGSGVLWLKNPRFLNQEQLLDLQYWNTKRLRLKYDQTEIDPKEKQGFVLEREKIYIGFEPKLNNRVTLKTSVENSRDQFSDSNLPAELKRKFKGQKLPVDVEVTQLGMGIDWGSLDWNTHLIEGLKVSAMIKYNWVKNQAARSFYQTEIGLIYASIIDSRVNFAQRILLGTTDTELLQYWNYFGGLDRIRGFVDNRFSGRNYFLSNSEIRITGLDKTNWVVQGAGFIDFLNTSEKTEEIDRISAASVGAGFRFIFPKIYRAVVRIDYAHPIIKNDDQKISFGLQQFF